MLQTPFFSVSNSIVSSFPSISLFTIKCLNLLLSHIKVHIFTLLTNKSYCYCFYSIRVNFTYFGFSLIFFMYTDTILLAITLCFVFVCFKEKGLIVIYFCSEMLCLYLTDLSAATLLKLKRHATGLVCIVMFSSWIFWMDHCGLEPCQRPKEGVCAARWRGECRKSLVRLWGRFGERKSWRRNSWLRRRGSFTISKECVLQLPFH